MESKTHTHTRKISPKLGILGVLGFLGFMGFLDHLPSFVNLQEGATTRIFFFFFGFFGFFGFYYEGKLSNTLIDERFAANRTRAEAMANKAALIWVVLVAALTIALLSLSPEVMLSVLIAAIGLALGASAFLQPYLLYRFENEE